MLKFYYLNSTPISDSVSHSAATHCIFHELKAKRRPLAIREERVLTFNLIVTIPEEQVLDPPGQGPLSCAGVDVAVNVVLCSSSWLLEAAPPAAPIFRALIWVNFEVVLRLHGILSTHDTFRQMYTWLYSLKKKLFVSLGYIMTLISLSGNSIWGLSLSG